MSSPESLHFISHVGCRGHNEPQNKPWMKGRACAMPQRAEGTCPWGSIPRIPMEGGDRLSSHTHHPLPFTCVPWYTSTHTCTYNKWEEIQQVSTETMHRNQMSLPHSAFDNAELRVKNQPRYKAFLNHYELFRCFKWKCLSFTLTIWLHLCRHVKKGQTQMPLDLPFIPRQLWLA